MKKFNEEINGLNINEMRELNLELKLEGFGAFSPVEIVDILDDYKLTLENDAFLENVNLDGAKAVKTVNGMRFVFVYRSGDWMLKSIKQSFNDSRDGLILTLKQEAIKLRARREIISSRGIVAVAA